ncbi:Amino acid/auxin permease [Globisporangium polare]
MMAYGDDSEMHERLLGSDSEAVREHLPNAADDSTMTMSDDEHSDEYELISERETLVFDQALFTARQQYDSGGDGNGSKESFFQAYLMNKIQPGSVKGSMFTMTVAIVGAGVLALPYAVEQAGLVLGILMITGGALVTNFSLRLLLTCSELAQARSYMDLAYGTGGYRLAGFTQFVVCLNLFGTAVGYLVGSAELIQLAMRAFLGETSHSILVDRQSLILLLCFIFVLPLSLFRSLESLRFSSLFSIVCIVFMALVIVIKYFQFVHLGLAPDIAYQLHHLVLFDWRLERLLTAFPLVIFVYTCHPNVLPIYLVLKRRSSRRMYKVMNRSIGIAAAVYALCGAFVVLTFGEHTKSNFLKNDYHGDGAVLAGCIGFSVALILTVPLFVHTLRDNIREALMSNRRLNVVSHALMSTTMVMAVLFVALGSGDIASVLGILGATTNPVICFVLPAFFIYRLGSRERHQAHKIGAILLAIATSVLSFLSLLQQLGGL